MHFQRSGRFASPTRAGNTPAGKQESPPLGPKPCTFPPARLQPAALPTPPLGNTVQQTCRGRGDTTQTCCRREKRPMQCSVRRMSLCREELWPSPNRRCSHAARGRCSPRPSRIGLRQQLASARSICGHSPPVTLSLLVVMAGAASAYIHTAQSCRCLLTCYPSPTKGFGPLQAITRNILRNQLKNQREHHQR